MIEVLGDGVTGLGKRLLHQNNGKRVECQSSHKDHSKKYRSEKKACDLHDDNSKFNPFL